MKNFKPFFVIGIAMACFTSCAPKIVGTWNVVKYESTKPGEKTVVQNNIGTMTFKKNGEGEKNLNYVTMGKSKTDDHRFGWHSTGPYVGIESPSSDFSRTWVIITNTRKQQKWKTNDGPNGTQVIELSK